MADKKNLIELQIGDTKHLVQSLKDIIDAMSAVDSEIVSLNKGDNFVTALQGSDPKGIDKATKSTADLAKRFDSIQAAIKKFKKIDGSPIDPELWANINEKSSKLGKTISELDKTSKAASTGIASKETLDNLSDLITNHRSLDDIYAEQQIKLSEIDNLIANAATFAQEDVHIAQREQLNIEIAKTVDLIKQQTEISKRAAATPANNEAIAKFKTESESAFDVLKQLFAPIKLEAQGIYDYYKKIQPKSKKTKEGLEEATEGLKVFGIEAAKSISQLGNNIDKNRQGWEDQAKHFTELSERFDALSKQGSEIGGNMGFLQKKIGGASKVSKLAAKGFSGLAKAAGPLTAAFEGAKLAVNVYDKMMGNSTEQIRKRIDALEKDIEVTSELNTLMRAGSVDAIEAQRTALRQRIVDLEAEAEAQANLAKGSTGIVDQMRTIAEYRLRSIAHTQDATTAYGEAGAAFQETQERIAEANKELNLLNSEGLYEATRRIEELNKIAKEAADAMGEFEERRGDLRALRMDAAQNAHDYQQDMMDIDGEFRSKTQQLAASRNDEDISMLRDHVKEMENIDSEHQSRLEDLRAEHLFELRDLEVDFNEEIKSIFENMSEQISNLDEDYFEKTTKKREELQREAVKDRKSLEEELAEIEQQFQEDRLRTRKDLAESLFEFELDNDALGFYMAKRAAKEEEEEAQKEHDKELQDARNNFKEEQDDKKKDFEEDKVERRRELNERKKEIRKEANEERAEKQKAFQESMQAAKKEYAERLEKEKRQYAEEAAAAAEAFNQRQKDLQHERDMEDRERQRSLEAKRDSLAREFELEQEYFQKREDLLMRYVSDFEALKQSVDAKRGSFLDSDLTAEESAALSGDVAGEIARLGAIGDLSADEQNYYNELVGMQGEMLRAQQAGLTVNLSPEDKQLLSTVIDNTASPAFAAMGSEYDEDFEFIDDALGVRRNAAQWDDQIGAGQSALGELFATQEDIHSAMELGYSAHGLATDEEMREQQQRNMNIRASEGEQNLSLLEEQADSRNAAAIENNREILESDAAARDEELTQLDEHFYGRQDQQSNALGSLQEDEGTYFSERADLQGDNLETLQEGQDDADAARLEGLEESNAAIAETDAISQSERIEGAIEFGEELGSAATKSYSKAIHSINSTVNKGMVSVVSTWSTGLQQIVVNTNAAATQMASTMQQAASYAQQASSSMSRQSSRSYGSSRSSRSYGDSRSSGRSYGATSSSSSTPSSSGSRKFGYGGSGFSGSRGLMAAKGAYIDNETLTMLAEDGSDEMVIPFDESSGIPDKYLEKFGRGMMTALVDKQGKPLPGSLLDDQLSDNNQSHTDGIKAIVGETPFSSSSNKTMYNNAQLPQGEMSKMMSHLSKASKGDVNSQFGDVSIGSDISRTELNEKFEMMMQAVVQVVKDSTEAAS